MKKGFTLIELLIVITIIGILAVVFLPTVLNAPAKARDVQRIAEISKLMNAVRTVGLDGTFDVGGPGSTTERGCAGSEDNEVPEEITNYLPNGEMVHDPSPDNETIPSNPLNTCTGFYMYAVYEYGLPAAQGYGFGVFVHLETEHAEANIPCSQIDVITDGELSNLHHDYTDEQWAHEDGYCYGVKMK